MAQCAVKLAKMCYTYTFPGPLRTLHLVSRASPYPPRYSYYAIAEGRGWRARLPYTFPGPLRTLHLPRPTADLTPSLSKHIAQALLLLE